MTSCIIILCFKIINLVNSIRASNDHLFKRLLKIPRYNYQRFQDTPELIEEFVTLCSKYFTFIDNWDDNKITPSTMSLYSKKIPVRIVVVIYITRVKHQVSENDRIEKEA